MSRYFSDAKSRRVAIRELEGEAAKYAVLIKDCSVLPFDVHKKIYKSETSIKIIEKMIHCTEVKLCKKTGSLSKYEYYLLYSLTGLNPIISQPDEKSIAKEFFSILFYIQCYFKFIDNEKKLKKFSTRKCSRGVF